MKRIPFGSLANARIIRKALTTIYGISESDWELLITLDTLNHFTKKDFDEGIVCASWNRNRMARMIKDGMIKQIYRHNGKPGDHSKYKIELAWHLKIKKFYKILFGDEEIPVTKLERHGDTLSPRDKHLLKAIKRFNKSKRIT